MRKLPYLSVVMPALNSEKSIGSLLVRIFDSAFRDFEVIVVDDASTDRTGQVIYEFCEGMTKILKGKARFNYKQSTVKVGKNDERLVRQWKLGEIIFTYHRLAKRGGAARARNEGVRIARGEVVLLFDSDVLPVSDMVFEKAKEFKKNKKLIAVTGFPGTKSENMGFGARYKYWRDFAYWHIENDANSFFHFRPAVGAIRRKIFWEAGGYDESYPGATMEDMEFSYRLAKFGKIVFDKNMVVAHPYGDLLDLVRTYFQRSYYYMELFLRRKQFTGVAMTGHEAYTIIAAAGILGGLLIWVIWGIWEMWVILLIIFIYLQKKFLGLVLKKEGLWFTIKAIGASYLLYIVICLGGARYIINMAFRAKTILIILPIFLSLTIPLNAFAIDTKSSPKKGAAQDYRYPMTYCNTTDVNNTCVVNYMNKVKSLGVSWLYLWGLTAKPAWLDSSIEFVPMIFAHGNGANNSYTPDMLAWYTSWARENPGSHWLIWNEPDLYINWLPDPHSEIPALVAARIYKPLYDAIKLGDPNAKIIVGGLYYIKLDANSWINIFKEEYKRLNGEYPPLDGWAFHYYEDYSSNGFRTTMYKVRDWLANNGYAEKEFWLTEFGNLSSNEIGLQMLKDQQEWLEYPAQSWITRYAFFYTGVEGNQKGNLLTGSTNNLGSAQLSPLGIEYAKHPINSVSTPSPSPTQTPRPTPTATPALTPSPTPSNQVVTLSPSWNNVYLLESITASVLARCSSGAYKLNGYWFPKSVNKQGVHNIYFRCF